MSDVEAGTTGVEVHFRPPDWIEGIVLDAAGEPAPGVTIRGVRWYRGVRSNVERLRTGADGRFRMPVGQGDLVEIRAGPTAAGAKREVVVPGVPAGTVDLVIRLK